MTQLTLSVNSSPFLATQVLHLQADDHQQEFPKAAALIRSTFYVDDCLTGASTLRESKHFRTSLNSLLAKGRMTLHKWRSSSSELLDTIREDLLEKEPTQLIKTSFSPSQGPQLGQTICLTIASP